MTIDEHGPPVSDPRYPEIEAALEAADLKTAATLILRRLGPEIRGYLTAVLRDRAAAGEAFSEFGERMWRALPAFQRRCSVRTWAHRLAWHTVATYLRDPYARRARPLEDLPMSREMQRASSTKSQRRAVASERLELVRDELSPADQTLLILRYDRGLSWDEIAWILREEGAQRVTPPALRKRFERLKARIRQRLCEPPEAPAPELTPSRTT